MAEPKEDDIQTMAMRAGDPALVEAKKEAIRTIDVFLDLHEKYKDNIGVYFAIKHGVPHDGDQAFLWYTFEEEKEGKLFAYHYNTPNGLEDFEKIEVKKEEISDWMINDHGHLTGGWSVRVQRLKLTEEERGAFDEHAGITNYRENNF
ncbi:DUF2314 domain-containing protein [Pelagicoccus sp. SDUM812005]|uniref:DUF2314 domain-containing protein n=1 Tax=Pelagicoccus sp. SDUM812005 TaxID=3041257 RepID=UPI00280D6AC9|nr:DUF2314 domain-containing protein [Pelagicoccus sp. SDUM812005]MDQ8183858.1 DUF2314 domain-containing protein [Pelagicoccus sp. SDUM812005]